MYTVKRRTLRNGVESEGNIRTVKNCQILGKIQQLSGQLISFNKTTTNDSKIHLLNSPL